LIAALVAAPDEVTAIVIDDVTREPIEGPLEVGVGDTHELRCVGLGFAS